MLAATYPATLNAEVLRCEWIEAARKHRRHLLQTTASVQLQTRPPSPGSPQARAVQQARGVGLYKGDLAERQDLWPHAVQHAALRVGQQGGAQR